MLYCGSGVDGTEKVGIEGLAGIAGAELIMEATSRVPMVLVCFTLMMSVLSSDRLPMRGTRQFILTKEIAMKKAFGFYDSSTSYSRHVKKVLDRYHNQASQELQPKTFSRHPNSKKKRSK